MQANQNEQTFAGVGEVLKHLTGDLEMVEFVCEKHGKQAISIFVGSDEKGFCKQCYLDEKRKEVDELLAKEQKEIAINRLKNCAIPLLFSKCVYSNFETPNEELVKLKKTVIGYGNQLKPNKVTRYGLVLTSDTGRGKTMLASILTKHAIHNGLNAKYISVLDYIDDCFDTYSDNSKSKKAVIQCYAEPDLLVIDELGANKGTKAEKDVIFPLVDNRYRNGKPTVFLGNCAFSDLERFVGSRVVSRMKETCHIIGIDSFDYRENMRGGK